MFSMFGIGPPTAKLIGTKATARIQKRQSRRASPKLLPGVTALRSASATRRSAAVTVFPPTSWKKMKAIGSAISSGRAATPR
jgi:hypothetical protein